jgi:PAS domain S-box-containing protein
LAAAMRELLEENLRLREELSSLDVQLRQAAHIESELRMEAQRFRTIMENNRSGILLLTPRGEIGELICPVFGFSTEQLAGREVTARMPAESAGRFAEDLQFLLRNPGAEIHSEYEIYVQSGQTRQIDAIITDRLNDPAVHALVVNYRDISDLKQSAARVELLASIVESSDNAIVSVDFAGKVMSWNAGAVDLYGYQANEMVGSLINLLQWPHLPDEEEQLRQRIQAGEVVRSLKTLRRHKSGAALPVRLKFAPLRNFRGQLIGCSYTSSHLGGPDARELLDSLPAAAVSG